MKIFVKGPGTLAYIAMFKKMGHTGTRDPQDADAVCFTGGVDINPKHYGQFRHATTAFNDGRDDSDMELLCVLRDEQLKIGICRGAQLLNIWHGGSLWQNVNGHQAGPHELVCSLTGNRHLVTSTHHQMMRPGEDGTLIGYATEADWKQAGALIREPDKHAELWWRQDSSKNDPDYLDAEVIWYAGSRALCFQPHPEFGDNSDASRQTLDYFCELLERFA